MKASPINVPARNGFDFVVDEADPSPACRGRRRGPRAWARIGVAGPCGEGAAEEARATIHGFRSEFDPCGGEGSRNRGHPFPRPTDFPGCRDEARGKERARAAAGSGPTVRDHASSAADSDVLANQMVEQFSRDFPNDAG
jgi:hypothetical protein